MIKKHPINVTQPALPPLDEYFKYLQEIWNSKHITNNGTFHQQFEKELAEYLGVKYISLFSNGTLALMVALKALDLQGEVITTPFSFVATANAICWNNLKPVFVDIEDGHFNIDPDKIEAAITEHTSAILPVNVYGNPCKVNSLKQIADKHNLKLIYDSAHSFGVKINGNSILNYGDLSVLSFHATKVFNTIEGGAIISHSEEMKKKIDRLKNFGFAGETNIEEHGINAKMNELQAAYGLLQLKYIDENILKRQEITSLYREQLTDTPGIRFHNDIKGVKHNYAYFPILVDEKECGLSRDQLYLKLKENNIFCRRYFYPLISQFTIYSHLPSSQPANLPVANRIAEKVLCLPIYADLDLEDVKRIASIIKSSSFS